MSRRETESLDKVMPLGPDFDNRVPGELLVKLSRSGEMSITESIPSGPIRRVFGELPTHFGSADLDKAIDELEVISISKVHSSMPNLLMSEIGENISDELPGIVLRKPGQTRMATIAEEMNSTYRIRFSADKDLDEAVKKLSSVESVTEVSPNYFRFAFVTPNDPMFSIEWGLAKINCPDAWNRNTGSPSVVVAVVDTGIDLDHPDLRANLVPGFDAVDLVGVTPRPGWRFEGDFLTRDNDPQDEVGHGTHVAGTIAALTNNATGVAGVTWNCKLMPVKVLARMVRNSDGAVTGTGTGVDIAAGIRYAADHGAHIINMSLGGPNDTFVERDAVSYAVGKGCTVIAAMGNDDISSPSYPAAYPDVVAVGAINQSEQRVSKANTGGAWGSNTGPHIDVVAPGISIRSTDWNNIYSNKSGTSMATPHVSGVAALIKSCNSSLTGTQIAQILRDTARALKDNPSDPVPNNQYGYGLIDAKTAVSRACIVKLKFRDDTSPKLKFTDDVPKLKVRDDIPKFKFIDDGQKMKFRDDIPRSRSEEERKTSAPFVLATPHHFTPWTTPHPAISQEIVRNYEESLASLESIIAFLEELNQQGGLTETGMQQLESLRQEYQVLFSEYQRIALEG